MTEVLETKIQELSETVQPMVEKANNLPMETMEEVEVASNYMGELSKQKKQLEEQRKFFTSPLNDQVKKINALFKTLSTPLDSAETVIKTRILEFKATLPQDAPNTIGNAKEVKTWTYEIEDEKKLPAEYMCIDHAKIASVVKAGVREISGVRIYQQSRIDNK